MFRRFFFIVWITLIVIAGVLGGRHLGAWLEEVLAP